jgi:hypothetical protein
MCDEHEEDIVDALRQDLSKPQLESIVYEVWEIPGITFFFFLKIFFSFFFLLYMIFSNVMWCDFLFIFMREQLFYKWNDWWRGISNYLPV